MVLAIAFRARIFSSERNHDLDFQRRGLDPGFRPIDGTKSRGRLKKAVREICVERVDHRLANRLGV